MSHPCRVHPDFREHLAQKRRQGFTLRTMARLSGFSDDANFRSQLREPFPPTVLNRSRWQTVAVLVNYSGDLWQDVTS